jgi:hypothetical protein
LSKANYAEYVAPLVKVARSSRVRRPAKRTTAKKAAPAKKAVKRRTTATAFSKLTPTQQRQIRLDLKVAQGRISDDAVAEWKKR